MTLGLVSLLVADTIYGILNSAGTFETGGFADAFWLGFYVLVACGAPCTRRWASRSTVRDVAGRPHHPHPPEHAVPGGARRAD